MGSSDAKATLMKCSIRMSKASWSASMEALERPRIEAEPWFMVLELGVDERDYPNFGTSQAPERDYSTVREVRGWKMP